MSRYAESRPACAANASVERADTTQGTTDWESWLCAATVSASAGGSSTMTWAFVPLIPNDDTPARRWPSRAGHGCGSVSNDTAPADQSTWGEGTSTCRVLGIIPCRIACTILITPATPAAAEV